MQSFSQVDFEELANVPLQFSQLDFENSEVVKHIGKEPH